MPTLHLPPPLQSQVSLEFSLLSHSASHLFPLPFGYFYSTLIVPTNVIDDLRVAEHVNTFQSSSHLTHQQNFPLLTSPAILAFHDSTLAQVLLLSFLPLFFCGLPFRFLFLSPQPLSAGGPLRVNPKPHALLTLFTH